MRGACYFFCHGSAKRFDMFLAVPLFAYSARDILTQLYDFQQQHSCQVNIIAPYEEAGQLFAYKEVQLISRAFNYCLPTSQWLERLYAGTLHIYGPSCVVCRGVQEIYKGQVDFEAIGAILSECDAEN